MHANSVGGCSLTKRLLFIFSQVEIKNIVNICRFLHISTYWKMENVIPFRNEELHDVLGKCLSPSHGNEIKNTELNPLITRVWTVISEDKCEDANNWLLHSRVAVAGLYYVFGQNFNFSDAIRFFYQLPVVNEIFIHGLNVRLEIKSPNSFRLSALYGYVHLLLSLKESSCDFEFLLNTIIDQCKNTNKYSNIYFHLLEVFTRHFTHFLNSENCSDIFQIIYYNLEKKSCCSVLQTVFKCRKYLQPNEILQYAIHNFPWKYKQKYILINEVLNYENSLIGTLPNGYIADGLAYGLSKAYLTPVAAKLHNILVRHVDEKIWFYTYFPAIEKLISDDSTKQFTLRNIVKYYLNFEYVPSNYFGRIFESIYMCKKRDISIILSLTIIGIKKGLFEKGFNFKDIINIGFKSIDNYTRAQSFEIICSVLPIDSAETYSYIKDFILFNLNSADQSTRESIKKSYVRFLNKLRNKLYNLEEINPENPIVNYSASFFEWLIPFLFEQFSPSANYQRLSLSIILIQITMDDFSKHKQITSMKHYELHLEYRASVKVFTKFVSYMPNFIEMFEIFDGEHSKKMIEILLAEIDPSEIPKEQLNGIKKVGFQYMSNGNKEIAECGQWLLEFIIRLETDEKLEIFQMINNNARRQWNNIRTSRYEDIVESNPLHPLISLMSSNIDLYNSEDYENLLLFLEDVVDNLLNVFGIRAMTPFKFEGNSCVGIAKVFKQEESDFYQCTVNCMWLVLKASCKLLVLLVEKTRSPIFLSRTLNLLNAIIQKCYHKGALEEAGDALSKIVISATTHKYCVSDIEQFLNHILETIPDATEATSTVRRGAETRLVLSAVALSDKRLHKPFFDLTMKSLMRTLQTCLSESSPDHSHSLLLHCFQPFISNNSVETHIEEYLSDLAVMTLKSFEVTDWKVKNAALQIFGAISNKMLGTVESGEDDSSRQHVVCLEEVFFKHSSLFKFIIERLSELLHNSVIRSEIVTPIFSFIGLSYGRNDKLIEHMVTQMEMLSLNLLPYMKFTGNFHVYQLVTNAYIAICPFEKIPRDIEGMSNVFQNDNNNNKYFSSMYTLKALFDKINSDDSISLPHYDYLKFDTLKQMFKVLQNMPRKDFLYIYVCAIFFYHPGIKLISPETILHNLKMLIEVLDESIQLPGFKQCLENKLSSIFYSGNPVLMIDSIKTFLRESVPISIKLLCLEFIRNRVQKNQEDQIFYSKELTHLLIEVLLDGNNFSSRYVTDAYVNLVLLLDTSQLDEYIIQQVLDNIDTFKTDCFLSNKLPIFCVVCEDTYREQEKVKDFFEWCAELYLRAMEQNEPEILVMKSLKYTHKFGFRSKNYNILLKILLAVYKMLQMDNENLRRECSIIFSCCFDLEPSYPIRNMMTFIDPDNLVKLVGPECAIHFLVKIFCERDEISRTVNVFERRHTLDIETGIIANRIYETTNAILRDNPHVQDTINNWFLQYKVEPCDQKYKNIIGNMLLEFDKLR